MNFFRDKDCPKCKSKSIEIKRRGIIPEIKEYEYYHCSNCDYYYMKKKE